MVQFANLTNNSVVDDSATINEEHYDINSTIGSSENKGRPSLYRD